MDHASAVETYAAERYLLGELPDADAESFEEHYFDCAICAEEVRHGMQLLEGGREIARESAERNKVVSIAERRSKRVGWMQITAAAVLAIGIAVPQLVQRDVPVTAYTGTLKSLNATRGEAVTTYRSSEPVVASYDIEPHENVVRYELEIRDANGEAIQSLKPVSVEEAKNTQVVTTGPLPVGSYTIPITAVRADGNRAVVETLSFQVVQ